MDFFFKLFVPFFVLGILLRLLDISNIGANGPALVGECDQVVCMRIERAESKCNNDVMNALFPLGPYTGFY